MESLDLSDNPICEKEGYKEKMFEIFPNLKVKIISLNMCRYLTALTLRAMNISVTRVTTRSTARKKVIKSWEMMRNTVKKAMMRRRRVTSTMMNMTMRRTQLPLAREGQHLLLKELNKGPSVTNDIIIMFAPTLIKKLLFI